jgi:hypothetical protein
MPLRTSPGGKLEQQRSQTQVTITRAQRSILKKLPLSTQKTLKAGSFTPRPTQKTVDPTQGRQGWPPPGPPVEARVTGPKRSTIVSVSSGGKPVRKGKLLLGEPLRPILRHEIGHQILSSRDIPSNVHHGLQASRGTEAGLGRLSRLSTPQLRRLKQRPRMKTAPSPGFQTPHLVKGASSPNAATRSTSREQMRRLGQRLKKAGVDF